MKKRTIFMGFLVFLGCMAVCTVVAKGIYKNGLARVQVAKPEKKSLSYQINGRGSVMPGEIYGVYVPEGLRIKTVPVQIGVSVQEGDVLLLVDLEDLEEKLQEETSQRDYLKAQIKDMDNAAGRQSKEKKKLEEQLLADYDNLVEEQNLLVSNAKLAMESARLRMDAAEPSEDVSGSDLQYLLLKKEYEAAKNAVEQARLNREEAVREWNRSLEESREEVTADLAARVKLESERSQCESTIKKLQTLKDHQGQVCAPEEGMLLRCLVEAGSRAGDGACLMYTRSGDGVEVSVSEEAGNRLSIGDKVTLQCKSSLGDSRRLEGVVRYRESENGQCTLQIEADVTGLPAGQTVQMSYSCSSERYETVIPMSALYQNNSSCFVYVLEQVEGILGTEYRPRKIPVTLLEQNGEYAAIKGSSIDGDSDIIIDSSKELSEEEAVRVISD